MYRPLLLIISLVCLGMSGYGQYDQSQFRKLTIANGLSDNIVNSVVQDEDGFIWIGTMNGLNRYDGRVFENYFAGNKTGLSGNRIKGLRTFSGKKIGVISSKGFAIMNTRTLQAQRFTVPDSTSLWFSLNDASEAAELPGGQYAFSSIAGFYVADAGGKLIYRYDHFSLKDVEEHKQRIFFGNNLFSLSPEQYLLYYQDNKLALYDARSRQFSLFGNKPAAGLADFTVPLENWTIKKQVNPNEFLFLSFVNHSVTWYNRATGRKVISDVPAEMVNRLYWDSYINFINDSLFTINCAKSGFYLFTLHRASGKVTAHPELQLPGFECRTLFTDRSGRLWIGTAEGVLVQQTSRPFFPMVYTTQPGQDNSLIFFNRCIYKHGDKLFVGRGATRNGLLVYDARTMSLLKTINLPGSGYEYNAVSSIQCYHPDTLWLATENGILWMNVDNYSYGPVILKTGKVNYSARMAPLREDGAAWMLSYYSNLAMRYNRHTRQLDTFSVYTSPVFPPIRPKFVQYDKYGDVWFGGSGLCRWNNRLQRFDTLILRFAGRYPLENNIVSMSADTSGSLWIATVDNSLLRYRIKERQWVFYGEEEGMPAGPIGSFSTVQGDQFWFARSTDLFNFNIRTGKLVQFGIRSGLPGTNITNEEKGYYYDEPRGELYFAVRNFITRFPAVLKETKYRPEIRIKRVVVNNEKELHFPADTLYLTHRENKLAIYPGIIDFENGDNYQYRYRLDGTGSWNPLGENPVIFLDRLSPGRHLLHILVTGNEAGSSERTLTIFIRPPFYQTIWFYILCLALLSALLFGLYQVRIRNVRRKALLNQRLAEFEMKALHAQMNPHFIFNCLNSIKGLIINNQNREASEYLTKFSSLVRLNLEHSRMPFVTLESNISYLRQYTDIEKLRFGNLHVVFDTGAGLHTEDILIAPMLLQPLVENAIWHGQQEDAREIGISFYKEGDRVFCRIDDNGIGILRSQQQRPEGKEPSVGLKNIRERIDLLNQKFGLDYHLAITDRSLAQPLAQGTTAILSFDVNKQPI